jgi:hypothetical protein
MATDLTMLMPLMGMFAGLAIGILIFLILGYVFKSLVLMYTAKKLGTKYPWLAWIPIADIVLMANMAKMHWWPVLLVLGYALMFIPVIGSILSTIASLVLAIYVIIWTWKICEARGKPGWWALIQIGAWIPILNFFLIIPVMIWLAVMWGILAWGK